MPSIEAWTNIITRCGRRRQWQEALELFGRCNTKADVATYNALMTSCQRASRWQWALWLFQQIKVATLQANRISYTAAIEACRGLDPDIAAQTALELLQTCDAGIRADVIAFNAAMKTCAGQLPRAVKVTEEILDDVPIAFGPNITDADVTDADVSLTLAPKRLLREGSARPLSDAPVLVDLTSPHGRVVSRYPGSITIREVLESQGLRLGFSDRLFQRRLVVRDRRATQVSCDLPLAALQSPELVVEIEDSNRESVSRDAAIVVIPAMK